MVQTNKWISVSDIAEAHKDKLVLCYTVFVKECDMGGPSQHALCDNIDEVYKLIEDACKDHPHFKEFNAEEQLSDYDTFARSGNVLFQLYNTKEQEDNMTACLILYNCDEANYDELCKLIHTLL